MEPIKFQSNRVRRTYRGGQLLDLWQGNTRGSDCERPEEWIASTVTAINNGKEFIDKEGLSRTENGILLKDLIDSAPSQMLGHRHTEFFGPSMGLLVKALDSCQRLSIQVHPDKQTAQRLFHSDYGKTEAWYILGTRIIDGVQPCIYAGFKPGITSELWRFLFDTQDISAMLDCLNKIPVETGQVYLIQGGVPHAIGAGCFIIEIQEPTDYTIRTERCTVSGERIPDSICHQGLGFDKMFDCFHYATEPVSCFLPRPTSHCEGQAIVTPLITRQDTTAFFMEEWDICGRTCLPQDDTFSLLVCLEGEGNIATSCSPSVPIRRGESVFLPAACTQTELYGKKLRLLRCLPPAPSSKINL